MSVKTYMVPKVYRPKDFIPVKRAEIPKDFLKYYGIIRQYVKKKYDMNTHYFEMMCFLYSEGIFNLKTMEQYNQFLPFSQNKRKNLITMGYISVFREATMTRGALYEVSMKGRAMMRDVYDRLTGEKAIELIKNPKTFSERQFNRVAKRTNEDFKEQRQHQPPSQ